MCLALPTPPERRGHGRVPGALLIFTGGIAFLAVLFGHFLFSALRRRA